MPYYDVANLVTKTKMNMINEMPCGCDTLWTTAVRIWHQVSRRACAEVSVAPEVSRRPGQRSQQLQNLTILTVNLVASWRHLHNCRCFRKHLRMLLQSLKAYCKAPGGAGSIRKYLEALVRATGVYGRLWCGFQTDLHFADVIPDSYVYVLLLQLLPLLSPYPSCAWRLSLTPLVMPSTFANSSPV